MGFLGGEQLRGEIVTTVVLIIAGASLTGLAELELGVCGEESLMVSRAAEGFFASCLDILLASIELEGELQRMTYGVKGRSVSCGHVCVFCEGMPVTTER